MAREIKFRTRGGLDIVNLTMGVEKLIDIREGVCAISAPGNSAIILNENESGLLEDFRALAKKLSAEDWSLSGGALLPNSVSIPVSNSSLRLGTWQRILFVELGKSPRESRVLVEFTESNP